MIRSKSIKKSVALFFLGLLVAENILPLKVWALTSGPVQPESKQFQQAGTSDMVDLFTGDFKYNIPLLDIDGYPVNLSYQSGSGMDDEASWVGFGWSLNPGAITRQLRGLPDDFAGDQVTTQHYVKPKVVVGGKGTVRMELKGNGIGNIGGSISLGVFSDNYTGIGAEFGANAGLSFSLTNGGALTGRLGIGVNSNTTDGVSASPMVSLAISNRMTEVMTSSYSVSAQLGYNTRQGLKDLTLSQSFGLSGYDPSGERTKGGSTAFDLAGSTISYNTPPFYPSSGVAFKSKNRTYSIDAGGTAFTFFTGGGLTGYKSTREVASADPIPRPAYGTLYAEQAATQGGALMDFMREKDNPAIPNLPNLPMPIATPDLFSYTGQGGSGQFRLYRGGTGVFYDAATRDVSDNQTLGGDLGFGGYFHGGVSFYNQDVVTQTGKWERDNAFLSAGDFTANRKNDGDEAAYFKQVGEKNLPDQNFTRRVVDEKPVAITLSGKSAQNILRDDYRSYTSAAAYKKEGRQPRRTTVGYLTASEATSGGLDRKIKSYAFNSYGTFADPAVCIPQPTQQIDRVSEYRKRHHISEISVHNDNGGRMVYGIPVYNLGQREMSFAIDPAKLTPADKENNLAALSVIGDEVIDNKYGKDHYLHDERQPAYASSYLLTGYLSPDYVDLTGDGITPDDNGTAVKFNYTKGVDYGWRTPVDQNKSALNRGQLADPEDDKGSVVFGTRENWYPHSIEGKNYIAYFITQDRKDSRGILDWLGLQVDVMIPKRLKEIRLYKKGPLPKLIKTVVFEYYEDYQKICPGVLNSTTNAGKLALKQVYFKYQTSSKGGHYPYEFDYKSGQGYNHLSTDRWGVLKPKATNAADGFGTLKNDEFPYATQNKTAADDNAAMWQLTKIKLPTGGQIDVDYESDDYSYVQDRRAMVMSKVTALVNKDGNVVNDLGDAKALRVSIPGVTSGGGDRKDWFIQQYLDGRPYLYAKLSVNVSDRPQDAATALKDFIPAYGKVTKVLTGDGYADVYFEDQQDAGGINPFQFAAWQKMRLEYPQYAFPGYRNRVSDDAPFEAALSAIVNAIGNLSELKENFYQRAKRKKFAQQVDLSRSFARVVKADGFKMGGGARVKRIRLTDNWDGMAQGGAKAIYGQSYEYTTLENGKVISSGVASYEPYIGGDENPLRQPVNFYTQEVKWALNNYFYLEEPFGESLYPAPVVGYRKITTRNLNESGNPDPLNKTGWTTDEYYTAKEFPVSCTYTSPRTWNYQPAGWFSFFGGQITHEMVMSQGYAIQLNDMHGKPKAQRVFNQSGAEIASTVYHYNAERTGADTYRLTNKVDVVNDKGQITRDQVIGREIEMYADMREQETSNSGRSINLGVDVIPFLFGIALPIPHWPTKSNDEYRLFRSASTVKTIQYYGIPDKIVKTVNGSSVTTNNLLYDQLTGEPVVVQQENEFGDPVYQVSMPAYWKYDKMGGAYKNEGLFIQSLNTNQAAVITNATEPLLNEGDELIDLDNNRRMWVVKMPSGDGNLILRLIRDDGNAIPNYVGRVKVYHSAYHNQLMPGTLSIVCKQLPYSGNRLTILDNAEEAGFRVIDAKATLFNEEWSMSGSCTTCPPGYALSADGTKCTGQPIYNTDDAFKLCKPDTSFSYGANGARFYDGSAYSYKNEGYWYNTFEKGSLKLAVGPLNNSGIWGCNAAMDGVPGRVMGAEYCVTVPETGWYSVGYGITTDAKISLGGQVIKSYSGANSDNYRYWTVRPVYLTAGKNALNMEYILNTPRNAIGVEIYKGTPTEILALSSYEVTQRIIFTTQNSELTEVATYLRSVNSGTLYKYACANNIAYSVCTGGCSVDANNVVNPYLVGYLGNWRPVEEKVFKVRRDNSQVFASAGTGANLRHSGYYTNFTPYWYPDQSGVWQPATYNASAWTTARTVTLYGRQGEELENRDVLGRYSAARYGFSNSLPLAVSSNAMNREIFYDSFEDDAPGDNCGVIPCDPDIFSIRRAMTSNSATLDAYNVHTGNRSLKLTGTVTMQSIVHQLTYGTQTYLDKSSGLYNRKNIPGLYPMGFAPLPNKKYIFSAWVKDGNASSNNPGVSLQVNNNNISLQRRAVAEGWKLIEGIIDLSVIGSVTNLTFQLTPAGSIWIDDIRIHPVDGQLKSYAYDYRTLRLMAELDENNYATFYEYDDEGSLIRLKKETDRGIMTLKENRSAYRRSN